MNENGIWTVTYLITSIDKMQSNTTINICIDKSCCYMAIQISI